MLHPYHRSLKAKQNGKAGRFVRPAYFSEPMPKPKIKLDLNQSEKLLALARQLADNAHAGIPYGDLLAELIGARRIELQGHL